MTDTTRPTATPPTATSPADDRRPHPTRRLVLRTALVGGLVLAGGVVWRADLQGVFAAGPRPGRRARAA